MFAVASGDENRHRLMDNSGPILVRGAASEEDIPEEDVCAIADRKPLSVPISEEVLLAVSHNTAELQDKLNKFVNGLNSKIQLVWFLIPYSNLL